MMSNNYGHMAGILKAALPHIGNKNQRTIGLLSSFMEFMGSFNAFNNKADLASCDIDDDEIIIEDLLQAVRPCCSNNEKQMIDQLLNFINIKSMFDTYSSYMEAMNMANEYSDDESTSSGNNDMFSMLKAFLPSEQMETFENLSMVLNTMSYDDNNQSDIRSDNDG